MHTNTTAALMLTHLDIDPTGQVHPAAKSRRRRQRNYLRWARIRKQLA